ncbi:MAG TPA: nucleotidyltransferase family protein [Desulfobacteria bacterium]|nr:nucleotidyltransferase family protein [Desulfobacteria bacterium]
MTLVRREVSSMLDVVILAGGRNSGPLRECSDAYSEAMIKIGQKPMIRYVAEALFQSEHVNKIVIIGSDEMKSVFPEKNVTVIAPEESAVQNVIKGLRHVDASGKVMIATCDIPLLTPKAVDEFIGMTLADGVDLFYPIVPMKEIRKVFPDIKRTSVKLTEGTFTGGNLFVINPNAVGGCVKKVEQFVSLRKSPLKLCRLLGMGFVVKFLLKKLSISEIEQKVSELLGITGRAVITCYPEIGVDVDKPSDLSIVSAFLHKPA